VKVITIQTNKDYGPPYQDHRSLIESKFGPKIFYTLF